MHGKNSLDNGFLRTPVCLSLKALQNALILGCREPNSIIIQSTQVLRTYFICYILYLEEYWLLHFIGNYLDFNNHTHLLTQLWKGYQRTALWTNIWHLGILLIGGLY